MGAGVVYGTDVFCALVLRPALARVDDAVLTAVVGNVHRYGDQRMPIPGVLGLLGAAAASAPAALAGRPVSALLAGGAFVLLAVWLVLYLRIRAPLHRADRTSTVWGKSG